MTLPAMANTIELADGIANSNTTIPPAPKLAPMVTVVSSGSQAQRFEWVCVTFINTNGESAPSPETMIQVPANCVAVVQPQDFHGRAFPNEPFSWNCYMSTAGSGTETKQNTTTLYVPTIVYTTTLSGNVFQEPATGLVAGAALPTAVAPVPGLVSGTTNLVNTPPATGTITVPQAPSGTVNTNTGRSTMATQTYLAK